MDRQELEEKLRGFVGRETGPPIPGPDPVNEAMIRHWCEAMGDNNPVYTDRAIAEKSVHGGIVAPPTMLQAWSMRGMAMAYPEQSDSKDLQLALHRLLTEAGYPSVVATNCEQGYTRYLRPGDQVIARTVIESISEQKATALGVGYFIDTRTTFTDQHGEEVGWMTFRVLKFKPNQPAAAAPSAGAAPAKPRRLRPPLGHDNQWWWEGIAAGELRIQRCKECGTLRHPPRPMCGQCQSLAWDWIVSKGAGTVHSYVVLHHPPVPGYEYPLPVALVDLDEGTRLVANVAGCAPSEIRIGMRVQARIEPVDEEMKLPFFYPVKG
ncbi:MAG TPA: bifunctional MaoC family dehydratase N-terminal/OB-fold nucleic acid binding domain-containing protein [Myxococcota bacterium]